MDLLQEAKNLISRSKNIYILPSEEKEENIASALALFYTLKELNKNVNLIIDDIPERLRFLTPSLDHISYPRNFVLSIPSALAEISQVRYEKDEKDFKIYLTIDKGNIKKSDVSFCFTEPKADLLIAIGKKELDNKNRLENNVLENSPILNIDNQKENKKFGKVNLLESESFLTELIYDLIKSIDEKIIKKNIATALLTGLILSSDNFRDPKTSSKILGIAAFLIEKDASHQQIIENLYKQKSLPQIKFLGQILSNLNIAENNTISWAILDSLNLQDLSEDETIRTIEQIKNSFDFKNLLVLCKSHSSEPVSKGFFYSQNYDLIKKMKDEYQGTVKNDVIFFLIENDDLDSVKNKMLKTLTS